MVTQNEQSDSEVSDTETVENVEVSDTETVEEKSATKEAPTDEKPKPASSPAGSKASLLADLHSERTRRKELTAKVTELTTKLEETSAEITSLGDVSARYERLEQFLLQIGGPISQALDSKSFSAALFESDTDINDLVTKWKKEHPTTTAVALRSTSHELNTKASINDLIRAALK